MRVAGVVLAAGASRRLGTAKQLLLDQSGQSLVARTATQLIEAGCDPVLVVTGSSHEAVAESLAGLSVEVVFNPDWEQGMATSIQCGLRGLESSAGRSLTDAILLTVCDLPSLSSRHLRDIIKASSELTERVASEFRDRAGAIVKGVPALFPRKDWSALAALKGDQGARSLLVTAETRGVFLASGTDDIDTPEDLARWRGQSGT